MAGMYTKKGYKDQVCVRCGANVKWKKETDGVWSPTEDGKFHACKEEKELLRREAKTTHFGIVYGFPLEFCKEKSNE